jgi:hypothetical protein
MEGRTCVLSRLERSLLASVASTRRSEKAIGFMRHGKYGLRDAISHLWLSCPSIVSFWETGGVCGDREPRSCTQPRDPRRVGGETNFMNRAESRASKDMHVA